MILVSGSHLAVPRGLYGAGFHAYKDSFAIVRAIEPLFGPAARNNKSSSRPVVVHEG